MSLTRVERERITDGQLNIQAATQSLSDLSPESVPDLEEIQECLDSAEKSLAGALRSQGPGRSKK
jgi:hypothetical protein